MAHHKTISLDEDTAKIADRLPNFSRFVRQCLIKHAATAELAPEETLPKGFTFHIAPPEARFWGESKDKCNPLHVKGRCPLCWGSE